MVVQAFATSIDALAVGVSFAALDLQLESLAYYMNGGQFTARPTTGLATRLHQSPYGVYRTADGYVCLLYTSRCV